MNQGPSNTKYHALTRALLATLPLLLPLACGPVDVEPEASALAQGKQAEETENGLSFNGLSFNGLSFNGLSFNGLSFNGLPPASFNDWFQASPSMANLVMRYVIHCAVPAGETRAYTVPFTGQQFTWSGGLGLAPGWASGSPATEAEEQVVSACLAAHANRLTVSVPISVLGRGATGVPIPFTEQELATHSRRESCFFGNAFRGQGLFVAAEREPLGPGESSSRACGGLLYGGGEGSSSCAPMVYAGACTSQCDLDSSGTYFVACRRNGITYRPLTTRLRPTSINSCGDGVCQATEKCGTSSRHDSCGLDCGQCP
ncbi:hypothetical protein [Pyxidicoccus xibeiensis]|uniref:hypothetical protein n=1 Tax=Pyxidicoccus xibeiensis TaxID=2906759 RepID=UPI0020A7FFD2|nr:hypothetical protein [Pyxidicoccus xibeiensis]MCP3141452.1 hypothetical protein [Pyxidicoccus xibeiensis]